MRGAQIESLTATVRVLVVGPAAMSVSMFAQLDQAELLDDQARYRGTPWGRVNHAAGCEDRHDFERDPARHAHVVWQRGDALARCCVRRAPAESVLAPLKSRRQIFYELMLLGRVEEDRPEFEWDSYGRIEALRWPDYTAKQKYGFTHELSVAFGNPGSARAQAEVEERLRALEESPEHWRHYAAEVEAMNREIATLCEAWKLRYEECQELPALLIGTSGMLKTKRGD